MALALASIEFLVIAATGAFTIDLLGRWVRSDV
jgi:hypothetical protein